MDFAEFLKNNVENDYRVEHLIGHNNNSIETTLIQEMALRRGYSTLRVGLAHFYAFKTDLCDAIGFRTTASTLTSKPAVAVCVDKALTKKLMMANGVPVAKGKKFKREKKAEIVKYFNENISLGVLKPLKGKGGRGVFTRIATEEDLIECLMKISSPEVILEEFIEGNDYRFSVVGGEVVSVAIRIPANVVGDGRQSVRKLINIKNENRLGNPHLNQRLIDCGEKSASYLTKLGLDMEYVPSEGEVIYLNGAANLSSGGDSIDVTSSTHETLKKIAVHAVRSIPGISTAGVDILVKDHEKAVSGQDVAVCEVNSSPGLSMHHFPVFGRAVNACHKLFDDVALQAGHGIEVLGLEGKVDFMLVCSNKNYITNLIEEKSYEYNLDFSIDVVGGEITGFMTGDFSKVSSLISHMAKSIPTGRVEYIRTYPTLG